MVEIFTGEVDHKEVLVVMASDYAEAGVEDAIAVAAAVEMISGDCQPLRPAYEGSRFLIKSVRDTDTRPALSDFKTDHVEVVSVADHFEEWLAMQTDAQPTT